MKNIELAWKLLEIADLLEIQGENYFKVRAYRRAAQAITELSQSVADLSVADLQKVPGVGEAISKKIAEWLSTGKIGYLEKLHQEIPPGVIAFTRIPGIGPKIARLIHEELQISTIDELAEAAQQRKIRSLRGLGGKTELSISQGIRSIKAKNSVFHLGVALPIAQNILNVLQNVDFISRAGITGDLRRFTETVEVLEFLVASDQSEKVLALFSKMPDVKETVEQGAATAKALLYSGLTAQIDVVSEQEYERELLMRTGSAAHVAALGQFPAIGAAKTEKEIYQSVGLPFIVPHLREDQGEIEAGNLDRLPNLVTLGDIKSDLHMHTVYSDGVNTVREMAKEAQRRGLQFIAICDHSRSLKIANGMSVERLQQQGCEIAQVSKELGFPILRGVECDILSDGTLDYDDALLSEMDIVVGSIHSGFSQEESKLTARILAAIENPHVDIIAHPTGRILGRREPYNINIAEIIARAKKHNKILELNATPDRFDLRDVHVRMASNMGVKIAINTDAHSIEQQGYMYYGVNYGQRAWLQPEQVVNTWNFNQLLDFLRRDV